MTVLLSSTANPKHSFADDSTLHAGITTNRPISVVDLERRRLATAASSSKDLKAINARGFKNMVEYYASKTQYCTPSKKRFLSEHSSIATAAGKKLGYLFRVRKYFSPSNLLTLYKAQIRPSLEYCSHIWRADAPTTLSILDAVQRRAIRFIGDSALACRLQPISHRRAVGDLSLFYWYSNNILTSIIPPLSQGVQSLEWTAW
nr:unnamed protein product [Callosobruchus chinensis]